MTARKFIVNGSLLIVHCLLSFFLLLTISNYLLPVNTFAQTPTPTPADGQPIDSTNYKAPQHSNYTIINLQHSMFCELTGTSPVDKCIGINKDRQLSLYDRVPSGGAVGGLTNVMVALYTNPPTSTTEYLADLGSGLGLIKEAHAQNVGGSGAGIIEPIKLLWQICRNISYVVFVVIFIISGFMIMFRAKINPQTAISIQSALPGLVIGLILVTFSYFISALIIDSAFLGIQVAAQTFIEVKDSTGKTMNVLQVQELAKDSNIASLFVSSIRLPENIKDVFTGTFGTIFSIGSGVGGAAGGIGLAFILPSIIGAVVGTLIFPGAGTLLGLGAGTAVGAVAGGLVTGIIGLIVPLILILALIIQFFKLLWKLVGAYIALLVTTVVSPFVILWASVPGKGGALGFWWKTLLGNALVFPAVFAAFLFAGLILATPQSSWNASPPLFGGLDTQLLRLIIAYGLILGTPAIPDLVKKAIGAGDVGTIAQQGAAGFMGGAGAIGTGYNQTLGRALKEYREQLARGTAGYRADTWQARVNKFLPFLTPH